MACSHWHTENKSSRNTPCEMLGHQRSPAEVPTKHTHPPFPSIPCQACETICVRGRHHLFQEVRAGGAYDNLVGTEGGRVGQQPHGSGQPVRRRERRLREHRVGMRVAAGRHQEDLCRQVCLCKLPQPFQHLGAMQLGVLTT